MGLQVFERESRIWVPNSLAFYAPKISFFLHFRTSANQARGHSKIALYDTYSVLKCFVLFKMRT